MSRLKIKEADRQVWKVSPAELEIFKAGRLNANIITSFYMKSPTSGTKWERKPEPYDEDRVKGFEILFNAWKDFGSPDDTFSYAGDTYRILWDDEQYPVFWNHHGWLFQDWQLDFHHTPQREITIIGGFGCGKTAGFSISLAILAMTIPNFRGFVVAPQMMQAMESYNYIETQLSGTPWWDRFMWRHPQKPAMFELRSSYIGKSTIEFLSIEDDPEKVRTLEGDVAVLDQAEKIQELEPIVRDLGSRLRGNVKGRTRINKLILSANAGSNPALWKRYDMGAKMPHIYRSFNPKSWDNKFMSRSQIEDMKRRVGGTKAQVDQWMGGQRPLGSGKHFPARMVELCINPRLDENLMNEIARQEREQIIVPTAWKLENDDAGVYEWVMPADHEGGGQYIVIGDPGQDDPPWRNSGAIMVWDVRAFPKMPAILRAFRWTYGGGFYEPFLSGYTEFVQTYHATGRNGFDSTGIQKGFDELYFSTHRVFATKLDMSGQNKYFALNAAKWFMGAGLMQFPSIPHLSSQLTNYTLPDTNIAQDLVACLCMSAYFIKQYFYVDIPDENSPMRDMEEAEQSSRSSRMEHSRSARSGRGVERKPEDTPRSDFR